MKKEEKFFTLHFTEKELKNPNIRNTMAQLVNIRAQLLSTLPYFEISEAELEIMNWVSLFTPVKEYGNKKYPNEVGKYKASRVVLRKEK